jgi:hypothetical protein
VVGALALHPLMRFGQPLHRLLAAVAPLLPPRDPPLGRGQPTLGLPAVTGMRDRLARRWHEEHRQALVEARLASGAA